MFENSNLEYLIGKIAISGKLLNSGPELYV